ncbi:MAG: hypothetical protein IKR33_06175 [Bacteroidales bacterium]|nr:hypothetical protein [Bacteroidales bacterium]
MPDAALIIGGLTIGVSGDRSIGMLMALPGFSVFRTEPSRQPDLTLRLDAALPPAEGEVLHRFVYNGGQCECRLMATSDGGWSYTFGTGGQLHIGPDGDAACTPLDDPATLRFAAWLAYSMTAAPLGRMPVHSSTVVCQGKAVMCLGESGTGKSTHTRLWQQHIEGATLLNDDSPIVAVMPDGSVEVHGSPWSGKAPCFRREHFPLAALLRLEQRPENSIRRLGTLEAFMALQPSCPPAMAHDERLFDRLEPIISAIIDRTPVYRLGCLPDADAARLSHSTIFPTKN